MAPNQRLLHPCPSPTNGSGQKQTRDIDVTRGRGIVRREEMGGALFNVTFKSNTIKNSIKLIQISAARNKIFGIISVTMYKSMICH